MFVCLFLDSEYQIYDCYDYSLELTCRVAVRSCTVVGSAETEYHTLPRLPLSLAPQTSPIINVSIETVNRSLLKQSAAIIEQPLKKKEKKTKLADDNTDTTYSLTSLFNCEIDCFYNKLRQSSKQKKRWLTTVLLSHNFQSVSSFRHNSHCIVRTTVEPSELKTDKGLFGFNCIRCSNIRP